MPPRTVPLAFDSSTLILFLNGALPAKAVQHLTQSVESNKAFISAVVRAEVLAWGGHYIASLEAAMALLDVCNLLPVDAAVADKAASIRRETGLKLPDALIAATALLHATPLVTANGRDFEKVPELVVIET